MKFKNSNCDETQNSKRDKTQTQMVMKLKNLNCDEIKNSNCDETQKL